MLMFLGDHELVEAAMSSSFTCTISLSFSTSTSSTSCSRDGHSPCRMQIDATDDLDHALQQQEGAGQRQDGLERIDRRTVGGDVRMFVDGPGSPAKL
jgi:hypothetical protein